MAYNFDIAKQVLNDNDKNRLVCLYLNCEPTSINWEKAARDFGAASVDSMRVMTRNALKKIADAGGKEGVEAKPGKGGSATPSGRKRKAADECADGEEGVETPAKKKRGRKSKAEKEMEAAAAAAEEMDTGEESDAVKKEEGDDE